MQRGATMNIFKLLVVAFSFSASVGNAATSIAVLDFELNDITSLPNTPAELRRTASMAPLLAEALRQNGGYQIIPIAADMQKTANSSFGYLFRFPDAAAKLGQQQGVDWIIVSQHSKPSFLFSYLWTYLINVRAPTAATRYDIELKGSHEKVTRRGIASLAKKIQATIAGDKRK
jgi:hypothetical protein